MATDLRERLQSTLGSSYTLETRVAGTPPTTHVLSSLPGYVPGEWLVETVHGNAFCQYQKGQRWITSSTVTGLYFRIHVTEIPPTL